MIISIRRQNAAQRKKVVMRHGEDTILEICQDCYGKFMLFRPPDDDLDVEPIPLEIFRDIS